MWSREKHTCNLCKQAIHKSILTLDTSQDIMVSVTVSATQEDALALSSCFSDISVRHWTHDVADVNLHLQKSTLRQVQHRTGGVRFTHFPSSSSMSKRPENDPQGRAEPLEDEADVERRWVMENGEVTVKDWALKN